MSSVRVATLLLTALLGRLIALPSWASALNSASGYECTIFVNGSNLSAREDCSCLTEGGRNQPAIVHCVDITSALMAVTNSTQVVVLEPQNQNLSLDPSFHFSGLHDVSLRGNDTDVTCESGGLTFSRSQRISIEGMNFNNCGAVHNSTSRNFSTTQTGEFLQFRAGLYFEFCEDVSFTNVNITCSSGIGLAMYGTVGENRFEHCAFFNNVVSSDDWGGGGAYIEFPYCSPGNPRSCNLTAFGNSTYEFSHCTFADNIASAHHPVEFPYLYPQDEHHLGWGRGGGLCVFFMNAYNISLTLDGCTFVRNMAAWGGGLAVEFQGGSTGNRLQVTNTVFGNNVAETPLNSHPNSSHLLYRTGGGGVRIGIVFPQDRPAVGNHILFHNVCFHDNSAFWGGGVSFGAVREPNVSTPSNKLKFDTCRWIGNQGRIGAAVELSMLYQTPSGHTADGYFNNCTFDSNQNLPYSVNITDKYVGRGTMISDGITIHLNGSNTFSHNKRTAIVIENAYLKFMANSVSSFTGNVGRRGGAISLWGHAFIVLHEHTDFTFVGNHAYHRGGAIAAYSYSRHVLYTFLNCFIQYADTGVEPWNWKTHFYFRNNTQGSGADVVRNAIHAVSLKSCFWNKWGPSDWDTNREKEHLFCWNLNSVLWDYGDGDCTSRGMSSLITSAAAAFDDASEPRNLTVLPGEPTLMDLSLHDDHFNNVTNRTVLAVFSHKPKDTVTFTEGHSEYITDGKVTIFGEAHIRSQLWVETNDPRSLVAYVDVTIDECPPGLVKENGRCLCKNDITLFGGIVVCSGDNAFQSKIRHGWWIGEHKNTTVAALSPFMLSKKTLTPYLPIPRNGSKLCSSNRNGTLCSECEDGYGFAVYSRDKICVKCSAEVTKYSWVLFGLVEFVPIGIFFFVLWFIGFKATNGPANAFICYAQLITTVFTISIDGFLPIDSTVHNQRAADDLKQSYLVVYDIWNLNFFRGVKPLNTFCLSPSLNALDLLMLEYLAAFFPLLLILILLIINRIKPLSFSPLSAVATFLVLAFSKITIISFRIMHPSTVFNVNGTKLHPLPYFYGGWDYGDGRHAYYIVVALLIGLVFLVLPTVLLILYPIAGHVGCQFFADWIGRATKQTVPLFLNEFYGCYKDGVYERNVPDLHIIEDSSTQSSRVHKVASQDYRFTAGLYFVLRIALLIVHVCTDTWIEALIIQQIIVTVAILYFSIFRPYICDLYNNLDALTFTILGTVNVISIYNAALATRGQDLPPGVFAIQYTLVYLPLIWMTVGILVVNRKWILDKAGRLRVRLVRMKLCCRKNGYSVLPPPRPAASCSSSPSSAGCVQDNDLSQSVRFSQEASPSSSQHHHSSSKSTRGRFSKRQRAPFSTGRPTGCQLEESVRIGDS